MSIENADVQRVQKTETEILAGGIIVGQIGFATNTLKWWFRQATSNYIEIAPVQEAPEDGKQYIRKDGAWYEIVYGNTVETTTLTATGTVDTSKGVSFISASSDITITMPTAVGKNGITTNLKRIDSNITKVTVDTTSAQTIDGEASIQVAEYENIRLVSDNSNWHIL